VSRNTIRTKVWLPAVKEAKLRFPVRMHDLRHAHASWLLAGGADVATVMERLGHPQIMTTQQHLHTLPDADGKALEAFSRVRGAVPD
jgi:integrase